MQDFALCHDIGNPNTVSGQVGLNSDPPLINLSSVRTCENTNPFDVQNFLKDR